ncbi:hypothetical protein NXS19_000139 [Fusarium pseudograminearum]|nr:hypothetical protein NXS19_000139 [Fusarium pseudograminearum]
MEAKNLLRSYCQQRQSLPDTEVNRPIIWICHDIGGTIVKQVLMEAAKAVMPDDYEDVVAWELTKETHHQIAMLSSTIIFLGCPHKSESFEVLQDEVLNLMSLPSPEVTNGRLGKVNNIAKQVDKTNVNFLNSRFFHRLTCINAMHLVDISEEGSEDGPRDELIVVPASPFSRYTMTSFSIMEMQNHFRLKDIDHCSLDQARGDISYRVIITTTGPDETCKAFIDDSSVLSLEDCPVPILGYSVDEKGIGAHGVKVALEHTIKKRPVLRALEETLSRILDECQGAPHRGYVILQWLSNFGRGASLAKITATVERLRPVMEGNLVGIFLMLLSQERRAWALRVYYWVKYAKEPLTAKALGQSLALSKDPKDISTALVDCDDDYIIDELQACFSGIVVVDRGEVKFSHESFYQATISNFDGIGTEQPSSVHGLIAKSCLEYMMQDCIQHQYSRLSANNYGGDDLKSPLDISERDLLEYAVQFWVHHYQLAEGHKPFDLSLTFFRTKSLRDRWAEASYLLSNPFTRIQRSYQSPLPLMASVGLDDIVSSQIQLDKSAHFFQQDVWLAITEAARNNHQSIVIDLLTLVDADEASLKDAIAWAAAAQNEDVMTELLHKVDTLKTFQWNQSLLSCAAITGSKGLTMAIAKAGFDLNSVDDETGQTALHAALLWGKRAVVEQLLSSNIDLSTLDHRDMTPLGLAVEMADPEIVQMLLDKGARVDQVTEYGELLVMRAAELGHHMVLERLILAGAEVEMGDTDDWKAEAVIRAAQNPWKKCVLVLLKHGANPLAQSIDGSLLYQCCTNRDTLDICRILLDRGADANESYSDKEMLFIASLRSDNIEIVRLLIDHGAKINSLDPWEDGDSRTPLSFAAANSSIEMVEFLLDKGADVNYGPEGACPALFSAALRQFNSKKLELLLGRGAKVDWRRHDGWQALHAAYDAPKSVQVLLKHGADVNTMCDKGTVTVMAAQWGHKKTLEVLFMNQQSRPDLDAKFTYDPDHRDYGTTAVRLAVGGGHYHCASFLLESGASLDEEIKDVKFLMVHASVSRGMPREQRQQFVKLIEKCFELGTKASTLDEEYNTALHHISRDTPASFVSIVLGRGAPLDNTNTDGWTPLAVALRKRNLPVAKLLLSRGARADIYSSSFGSLLHVVCDWESYGSWPTPAQTLPLLRLLIQREANPEITGPAPESESLLYTALRWVTVERVCEMTSRYLIEEAQADVNFGGPNNKHPLIAAVCMIRPRLVQYLIRRGADVEVVDDQGLKPCHHSAMRLGRNSSMLRLLTKSGVDLEARDLFDRTPLHFASSSGDWSSTRRLIRQLPLDFDVDIKDSDGWTPLMWACRSGHSEEIIRRLIQDYGADIWTVSNDGQWSPLKLANFADYPRDLTMMLEPPEDKMERIIENASKQVWDASFHLIHSGKHDHYIYCKGCMVPIIGPIYTCVECGDSFQLCFKCFPHRKRMHDPTHELKELANIWDVIEEGNEQSDSSDEVDDAEDDEDEEDEVGTEEDDEESSTG